MPLTWIDPFSPATTEPPRRLAAFFRWALKGSGPALGVAGVLSIFAGVIEVMAALVLGWVVDAALAAEAGAQGVNVERVARPPRAHAPLPEEEAAHRAFLEKLTDPVWSA